MTPYELQILGDSEVGKTALIHQLCYDRFTETHSPTIHDSYRKYFTTENGVCSVDILETGGLNNDLICPVDCYILVYSITSRDSFTIIPELYDRLEQLKRVSTHDLAEASPNPGSRVLLVANKIDQTQKRLVSTKEGQKLAKRLGCGFFEASAKQRINIDHILPKYNSSHSMRLRRPVPEQGMKHPTPLHKIRKAILNRNKFRWDKSAF
ncbi:hypothetical protein N7526_001867 [Penicillium atrosanguineum]|nr:hypothetical protein N7526_001867 [Penicillium atrosanguineum]